MDIKLIAVDMDGTFLTDAMDYDRETFNKIYQVLKQQGVHFVVASGNQYYQLKSFFGDIQDEITYVAENGAMIVEKGECIFHGNITDIQTKKVLTILKQYPEIEIVVCGVESAYTLDTVKDSFFKETQKYYHRLKKVASYDDINDQVIKFALTTPDYMTEKYELILKQAIGDILTPTSSGHNCIDLIIPGLHKASGIKKLVEHWGITKEQCMAFGDNGNDIEMLQYCKYGYAMENAREVVKNVCHYHAKSNNDSGVLTVLSNIFL